MTLIFGIKDGKAVAAINERRFIGVTPGEDKDIILHTTHENYSVDLIQIIPATSGEITYDSLVREEGPSVEEDTGGESNEIK